MNPKTYESEEARHALVRAQGRNKMVTITVDKAKVIGIRKYMRDFTFGRLENAPKSAMMQFLYTLPLTKKGDVRKNGKIHIGWCSLDTDRKGAYLEGNYTQGILCKKGVEGDLEMPLKHSQNFEDLIPMYYPFSYDTQYFSKNNQPEYSNSFRLIDNYKAAHRFFHDLDYSQILCKMCFDIGFQDYGLGDGDGGRSWFINPKGVIKVAEYQPNQSLEDYSPTALTNSSAIQGFEPLKYSIGPSSLGAEDNDLICSQCGSNSVQKFKDFELGDWEICFDCGKAVEITDDWVIDIDWDTTPADKSDIFEESIEWDAETLLDGYSSEQNMEWLESPKWAIGDFEVPAT